MSNKKPVSKGGQNQIDNRAFDDAVDIEGGANQALSYEVIKTGNELETYIDDIADTVRMGVDQSISILTPWFFNNMPHIY